MTPPEGRDDATTLLALIQRQNRSRASKRRSGVAVAETKSL
jgi:hypothetical protein